MPRSGRSRLTLFLALVLPAAAPAAEYHVATTGDDRQSGTRQQPLRTIQRAAERLQPGDTCRVEAGVYPERVTLRRSGEPGRPLTLLADGPVRLRGFDLEHAQHTRVIGFEITDVPAGQYGILLFAANHAELWHNHIHHLSGGGIRFHPSQPSHHVLVRGNTIAWCGQGAGGHLGITVSGDANLIESNDISHVNDFVRLFGRRNVMRNNYLHDSYWSDFPGTAPHIDGMQHFVGLNYYPMALDGALIEANLMANVPDQHTHFVMLEDDPKMGSREVIFRRNVGWKLGGYALLVEQVPNVRVIHNTMVDLFVSGPKAWYCLGFSGGAVGGKIANNLFVRSARHGGSLYTADDASRHGLQGDYNLAFESGDPREPHGIVGRDPLLMEQATGDARLGLGSPAIDAGGPLTLTRAAGRGTVVPVVDSGDFVDGWGVIDGDLLRIGGGEPVRLTHVDGERRQLTVARPIAWREGDRVDLDYQGSAPDMGAFERSSESQDDLRVVSPAAGEVVAQPVTLKLEGCRPEQLRELVLLVDGLPVQGASEPPYRLVWDPASVPAGEHRLIVRGYRRPASTTLWADSEVVVRTPRQD